MNFGKLYDEASGRVVTFQQDVADAFAKQKEQHGERLKQQITAEWLQHPATQEMIKDLTDRCNNLIDGAVQLALTYPQHNNHQLIIQNLVRANQITQLINIYANRNTSS